MPAKQLFMHIRALLRAQQPRGAADVLTTLALMVSGLLLGRSVQLWEIAVWIPWDIQLTSGVRRLERWLANPGGRNPGALHRLLALNRLQDLTIEFSWDFTLPKPGFRPVY